MKRLSILGSTGSIGRNALAFAAMHPDRFKVTVLAAGTNIELLASQIQTFRPETVAVLDEHLADRLEKLLGDDKLPEILYGSDGYRLAASHANVDAVLLAMVGAAGLMPALAAIESGKHIALANKETLVMAGELVMGLAEKHGVTIYPVDSEHSAIFQCLEGNRKRDLKTVFLTASGGPFRTRPLEEFHRIRPQDALSHPTWEMGNKITIDSATLMNKGLELIEAVRLFRLPASAIEVLVHPQSIVHSMVGFTDGSVMAQLGIPDMRTAIAYALSWPERLQTGIGFPDFANLSGLFFESPDVRKFPSLDFARQACMQGGTLPAVMNAANEVAVDAFLNEKINFPGIFSLIDACMGRHNRVDSPDLSAIVEADAWARETAMSLI